MEKIYQVLVENQMGIPVLQDWYESEEDAKSCQKECNEFWPEDNFWIEEGIEYIYTKCKGCGTVHANECHDAYGITTGYWCTKCYESEKYPYKKNRYDYKAYGERLDNDY